MNRRWLLATLSLAITGSAKALPPDHEAKANHFAETYNTWIGFRKVVQPEGVVDAREVLAWRECCKAWSDLKKATQY